MQLKHTEDEYLPYHISCADVCYGDIIMAPNVFYASYLLWNCINGLVQRQIPPAQLNELLDRLHERIGSHYRSPGSVKFGQGFGELHGELKNAEKVSNTSSSIYYQYILQQLEIVKAINLNGGDQS
ncbi:hypothetical protein RCC89_16250 [Cytophagaceae bacterium ABcell3]|nr:hypothetical protein RCC89_16250 [Cytophagaceae bacterium ABcell3]